MSFYGDMQHSQSDVYRGGGAVGYRALAPPRKTQVVKTSIDSSTAKRSAIGVSVAWPRRWPYKRMSRDGVTVGVAR